MNRKEYKYNSGKFHQATYAKVLEQMDLLGIVDITTTRQDKNGTIIWKLPIKNNWRNGTNIEVGSFKSGIVRNNNSAHSNYQLNRCKSVNKYFKDYKITWNDNNTDYTQKWTGKYNKYACKERILIPIEIDRLEYLISYCLKNYYIKRANEVTNGELIPKWKYESYKNEYKNRVNEVNNPEISVTVNGQKYKVI